MNASFDLSQTTPRLSSEKRTLLTERQKILPSKKKKKRNKIWTNTHLFK